MFRFEEIEHLYIGLIAIPVLLILFLSMRWARKRAIEKFGDSTLMAQLMPQVSRYKHTVKFVYLMLGLAALTIAWANPQWGSKKEKVKQRSADVFIALDISQSMLGTDISPNRLERAKRFAEKLVEKLKGERIGIIVFAGNAYLQMPLTTDYAAAYLFLKSANTRQAPTQGTAIGEAIDLAEVSFQEENKSHKTMIIISDGENHDEEAIARAAEAHENGLLIFTIGVGTEQGSLIPINVGGMQDYKRDRAGKTVRTTLNESMLNELALAGDGEYFNISEGEEIIEVLQARIEKMEKQELETRSFSEYESYFQIFLGIALFFILLEFLLSYRKSEWLRKRDIF